MDEWSTRFHAGFLVSRATLVRLGYFRLRLRGSHPLRPAVPKRFCSPVFAISPPATPDPQGVRFGLFPLRSPLLGESQLLSFPPGTEMFHFPGFSPPRLWIQRRASRVCRDGLPHSDIFGSSAACAFPKLFAACHVLLRLPTPRHSPYALISLTTSQAFPARL